jgi:maltooligosyltrehalose trehalohydrolase
MDSSLKRRETLGATDLGDGRCEFVVWAPFSKEVDLCLVDAPERRVQMNRRASGYYQAIVEGVEPGARYVYHLDGAAARPDPASRFQGEGVHGPSQIVCVDFPWDDTSWFGPPLNDYIFYELHVGTYSKEGNFDAIVPRLAELKSLGVTAIELMPVAQFSGHRNWGYDGVFPFAVQNSYGGPAALKALVRACHQEGIAVALDVVYNHLGPEGNYLGEFGPYFTDRYRTPWGPGLNFDGPESDEVRRYFVENALYWVTDFHIDALRLDAIHAIVDHSAQPLLQELTAAVHQRATELNRRVYVIAESDLNDVRVIQPRQSGGYGFDAQWNDNFHHALHTVVTGEREGYYQDFGQLRQLAKAYAEGFVYSGEYSVFRRRRHGNSSRTIPAQRFVVCSQNHDQIGNRMLGDRLSGLVCFEALKLAAGIVVLSPYLPLLFMGEEYGEPAPFLYFTSHSDASLAEAVRRGRREEFSGFAWQGEAPDPQDEATFLHSKIDYELRDTAGHRILRDFYRELIRLRRINPALAHLSKEDTDVIALENKKTLFVRRRCSENEVFMAFSFAQSVIAVDAPVPPGCWQRLLDSSDEQWKGDGSLVTSKLQSAGEVGLQLNRKSFVIYEKLPDQPM